MRSAGFAKVRGNEKATHAGGFFVGRLGCLAADEGEPDEVVGLANGEAS